MTRDKSESLIAPQSSILLLLEGLLFTQNFMGCLTFSLRDNFIAIEDDFISGFNTILSNPNQIIEFTEKWKPLKINSEIDNT